MLFRSIAEMANIALPPLVPLLLLPPLPLEAELVAAALLLPLLLPLLLVAVD